MDGDIIGLPVIFYRGIGYQVLGVGDIQELDAFISITEVNHLLMDGNRVGVAA